MILFQFAPKEQSSILFDLNTTDVLKFVACIMVAMSHFAGYASVAGFSNPLYAVIAANCGYLGVALFFLSGYGLMMSDQKKHLSLMDFLKKRLSKTYLPAVLVSFIWLLINVLINVNGSNLLCNNHYFFGVIWRFNDEVMWFVTTIIVLYLFFYLFRWFSVNIISRYLTSKASLVEFSTLVLVGIIATPLVRRTGIGDPISVPLFFIGISLACWQKEARRIFRSWVFLLVMMVIMVLIACFGRYDNRMLHGVINYFAMGSFVAILAFVNIRIDSLPKWVGNSSYDLYLVHYKVHLLMVYLFGIDKLWMFAMGTAIATALFHQLRSFCKLWLKYV